VEQQLLWWWWLLSEVSLLESWLSWSCFYHSSGGRSQEPRQQLYQLVYFAARRVFVRGSSFNSQVVLSAAAQQRVPGGFPASVNSLRNRNQPHFGNTDFLASAQGLAVLAAKLLYRLARNRANFGRSLGGWVTVIKHKYPAPATFAIAS